MSDADKVNIGLFLDPLTNARVALQESLKQPTATITCKLLTGGMDEGAVVLCVHGDTKYIVKLFEDTVAGKNEAIWTMHASRLGVGPKVYYADPAGTYFIMEFVEGISLTPKVLADPANQLILQNLAKNIALFHRSTISSEHVSDIFTRIEGKYRELQASGALQSLLAGLWRYIKTLQERIRMVPVALVPCHNDLNPRNIFVQGGKVTLIDWGDTAIANPYYDIAAFFVLNALTEEQEALFLAAYDATLLEQRWLSYLSMLKQVVRFEWALNLLRGVQYWTARENGSQSNLLVAVQLPQVKSHEYYLTLFAEQQVPTNIPFKYAMGLASLNEMRDNQ